jgi:phosphoglucosamine mutase
MRLFGTDGIRGVAGDYPLDAATVRNIGRAAARVLKQDGKKPLMLLGRDTRESGGGIAENLGAALVDEGVDVWDVGVIPTPGIACLARRYPVLAGIVISASHNPYQDNGIKFFGPEGTKLADAIETAIEKEIVDGSPAVVQRDSRGTASARPELVNEYLAFLTGTFPEGITLKDFHIVIDCANGATFRIAEQVLSALGARVTAINVRPDGKNINLNNGALHPDVVAQEVVRLGASCGLAFDGDGDRIIFCDETGTVRDGDFLLSIAADYFKGKGKLAGDTLVTTVMANLGLLRSMRERGIRVITTAVGDRYVFEAMVNSGAVIGGEQSGHLIFSDHLFTGDGILSALQMLAIMRQAGRPLSQLSRIMRKYPQVLLNTRVKRKIPVDSLPLTRKVIGDGEMKLQSDGRVLVRYSGTENLLRVMIEGLDKQMITALAREISDVAQREIESLGN